MEIAILAYSRSRYYYYAYYVLRTLIGMLCDGSVHCLALAYVVNYLLIFDYSSTH